MDNQLLCQLYYFRGICHYQLMRFDSSWKDTQTAKRYGQCDPDLESKLSSYRYVLWKMATFSVPIPSARIGGGPIYFHWTILAFISYLVYYVIILRTEDTHLHSSILAKLLLAILCTISFLFAVLIHEAAHGLVMSYFFNEKVSFIVVHLLGGKIHRQIAERLSIFHFFGNTILNFALNRRYFS